MHEKLDQIDYKSIQLSLDVKDLPHDVVVVDHKGNDDDNDDPGAGAERIRDARDFIRKTRFSDYIEANDEEEKELRGDEKIKMHKHPRDYDDDDDEDDADNDQFYSPARSNRSEAYKDEILNLREINQRLQKEVEDMIKTYPELTSEFEQRNKVLVRQSKTT